MSIGTLSTLDCSGDTRLTWDSGNADDVEVARAAFDSLRQKGYAAFKVEGKRRSRERGEIMRDFDPGAEQIIMVKQLVGG